MRNADQQIFLITGATDGLGRRVAEDLAGRGPTLLLHGRNPEKGAATVAAIGAATGNERLHYYNADFSSLAEAGALADAVAADWPRLDVLVNNAGLGAGPDPKLREVSADGHELRFAVNYLAPFLLTYRLLPLLRKTAAESGEARIVNVASVGQQDLDFADPMLERGYDGVRAYRQSKLALVMFTFDLAEELKGSGVTANVLHPASLMDTRMVREWFGKPWTTVEEGARAVERLVESDELGGVSGEYFDGLAQARAREQTYDVMARRRLHALSEKWTGAH